MTNQSNPPVSFVQLLSGKLSSFIHQSDSRSVYVLVNDGLDDTMYRLLMTDNGWQLRLTEYEKDGLPLPAKLAAASHLDDGHDEPHYSVFQPQPKLSYGESVAELKRHLVHNRFEDEGISRYQWRTICSLNAASSDTVTFMVDLPAKNRSYMLSVGDNLVVGMKIGTWANRPPRTLGRIVRITLPRS